MLLCDTFDNLYNNHHLFAGLLQNNVEHLVVLSQSKVRLLHLRSAGNKRNTGHLYLPSL